MPGEEANIFEALYLYGRQYLFEHHNLIQNKITKYSRNGIATRIKKLKWTPSSIRHLRGKMLVDKYGIGKAATELGHKSIQLTKQYYTEGGMTEDEFISSLDAKKK